MKTFLGKLPILKNGKNFTQKLTMNLIVSLEIFIYDMKKSVSINQDYVMVTHNPTTYEYEYLVYRVLDISYVDNIQIVNVQHRTKNNQLKRLVMPYHIFLDLVHEHILTRLQ